METTAQQAWVLNPHHGELPVEHLGAEPDTDEIVTAYMVFQVRGTREQIKAMNGVPVVGPIREATKLPYLIGSYPVCPPGRDITDDEWLDTLRAIQAQRAGRDQLERTCRHCGSELPSPAQLRQHEHDEHGDHY